LKILAFLGSFGISDELKETLSLIAISMGGKAAPTLKMKANLISLWRVWLTKNYLGNIIKCI